MNKKYYFVSFQYSESVFCTNIVHADDTESIEKHYAKYSWYKIIETTDRDIVSAKRRGMPIIEL